MNTKVYNKLKILNKILKSENIIIADRRGTLVKMGLTLSEANFFSEIDERKCPLIARFFLEENKEYLNLNKENRESNLKKLFNLFNDKYSLNIDDDYHDLDSDVKYDLTLIDKIINDESFYQRVKNKDLHSAFKEYENGFILVNNIGSKELECSNNYTWYYINEVCPVTSHFMKNCGSIGDLGPEGEYANSNFGLLALKDNKGVPHMLITYGEAYCPETGMDEAIIINMTGVGNKFTKNNEYLDCLKELVLHNNYKFAKLYVSCFEGEFQQSIGQYPGIDFEWVESSGFGPVLNCCVYGENYSSEYDEE